MYNLIFIFTVSLAALTPTVASANTATPSEYNRKAEFIYNFSKFTKWPDKTGELVVCIYGKDPFGSSIDNINNKFSNKRKIKIVRTKSIAKAGECHIAYINNIHEQKRYYRRVIRKINSSSVLTMADHDNADSFGVMIGLINNKDNISFKVNDSLVSKSNLKISSKLLRLAKDFK